MGRSGQQRCTHRTYGSKKRPTVVGKGTKRTATPTKLKAGVVPGAVLILLAGRFRGRRVVFLKQLSSGLLLVTGPYKVNGVPLRRVNQRYCIATSARVDVNGVDCQAIDDAYFARDAKKKQHASKPSESQFFAAQPEEAGKPEEKKSAEKKMDEPLVKALSCDMSAYLKARFTLTSKMYPHELKF